MPHAVRGSLPHGTSADVADEPESGEECERAQGEELEGPARHTPGVEERVLHPEQCLDRPGKTATHEPSAIEAVQRTVSEVNARSDTGTLNGRGVSANVRRSRAVEGMIAR